MGLMLRRLPIIIALLFLPAVALATQAADLGPATTPKAASDSTATANALQPNASQTLQSSPDPQTQSLAAPNLNTLQSTADKLTVTSYLRGEGDGAPATDTGTSLLSWVPVGSLVVVILLFSLYHLLARRRLHRQYVPHHAHKTLRR